MFIFGIDIDSKEILADRKYADPSTTLGSFRMPDLLHSLTDQEILAHRISPHSLPRSDSGLAHDFSDPRSGQSLASPFRFKSLFQDPPPKVCTGSFLSSMSESDTEDVPQHQTKNNMSKFTTEKRHREEFELPKSPRTPDRQTSAAEPPRAPKKRPHRDVQATVSRALGVLSFENTGSSITSPIPPSPKPITPNGKSIQNTCPRAPKKARTTR